MTEAEHNDEALRVAVTKIVDRLAQEHLEYEERVAAYKANLIVGGTITANKITAKSIAAVSATLGSINITSASIGNYMVPGWVPYLSASEYETLKAWRDGDNMILHKLRQP